MQIADARETSPNNQNVILIWALDGNAPHIDDMILALLFSTRIDRMVLNAPLDERDTRVIFRNQIRMQVFFRTNAEVHKLGRFV